MKTFTNDALHSLFTNPTTWMNLLLKIFLWSLPKMQCVILYLVLYKLYIVLCAILIFYLKLTNMSLKPFNIGLYGSTLLFFIIHSFLIIHLFLIIMFIFNNTLYFMIYILWVLLTFMACIIFSCRWWQEMMIKVPTANSRMFYLVVMKTMLSLSQLVENFE